MMIEFKQWCENHTDIVPLVRSMKSSVPEQYIGFYLQQVFENNIEYQKCFDWLGRRSLDIYIPSLELAIEYDGAYYHSDKGSTDKEKDSLCRSHNIRMIRIREQKISETKTRKRNEIGYYFDKNYKNIDVVIKDLCFRINKLYNESFEIDVNLERDRNEIISYIQNKYYEKSIANVWPESKDYWINIENGPTIYDVFYTSGKSYNLRCPHCGKKFVFHMRYFNHRKSLIPCECEYADIESDLKNAVKEFMETGKLITFDDSLRSRRLYDRMQSDARWYHDTGIKEKVLMYKQLGFESPYLNILYSQLKS